MWWHETEHVSYALERGVQMYGTAREGKACLCGIRKLHRAEGIANVQSRVHCLLGAVPEVNASPRHASTL